MGEPLNVYGGLQLPFSGRVPCESSLLERQANYTSNRKLSLMTLNGGLRLFGRDVLEHHKWSSYIKGRSVVPCLSFKTLEVFGGHGVVGAAIKTNLNLEHWI